MAQMIKHKSIINEKTTLLKSLSILNKADIKCLIITDKENKVKGTLTDGDIRRSILRNIDLNSKIKNIYNKKFKFFFVNKYNRKKIRSILENKENHIDVIPILKKSKKLEKLFTLKNFKKIDQGSKKNIFDTKVVIMAGGLGKRLLPLTKKIPKALIKFKDKTFLEIILESFFIQGFKDFSITLFHKKKLIQNYLNKNKKYSVECLNEPKPLGTAGGLKYLKKNSAKYFMVTNCDNFYKINYNNLLNYHKKFKYDFTVVASKKTLRLPYGICKVNKEKFLSLVEKPEYSNLVNSGLYVLSKKILKNIKNKKMDMNELIEIINKKKYKIGVYPIDEKSWIDVGTLSNLSTELHIL